MFTCLSTNVIITNLCFQIAVNGKHLCDYEYRVKLDQVIFKFSNIVKSKMLTIRKHINIEIKIEKSNKLTKIFLDQSSSP